MIYRSKAALFAVGITTALLASCSGETLPKPSAQLRLEYQRAQYAQFENDCPYTFHMNAKAIIKQSSPCSFEITYPQMKGTLYLTYKPVRNNIDSLLRDAQKLTYKHVIKADDILEQPYLNPEKNVYGMFYLVKGNAATNTQFYATDSTRHFITGALYFYAKPNFDSIMPAASYIKDDMRRLMESLEWK